MFVAKTKEKINKSIQFCLIGYVIASICGCIGSYIVFICLWSLYGVPHVMFALLAICSGGIISFIIAIYCIGEIFVKR